ncbi:phage tail sheath family protein [Agromyces sp. NPDC056379]|uniref:phage tail sheath family protein n=1 Tax=unclassified Agromyces TaxID=2639701 RepID=UPI0035DABDA4
MLQLTYPGVYTREQSSGARAITGASTSVAHFIGPSRAGIDKRSVRCFNFGDFEREFGGLHPTSSLSYSVLHFFANGGSEAFVTRLPVENAKPAQSVIQGEGAATSVTFTALSSGTSGNGIFLEFDRYEIGSDPLAVAPATADKKRFNLTIVDSVTGRVERFGDLTTVAGNARTADSVVNDPATGSKLVKLTVTTPDQAGPVPTGSVYHVKKAPVAGTFPKDQKLTLSISRFKADGTADVPESIVDLPVTVFTQGSAQPISPRELVTKLVAALNSALRDDAAAVQKLGGAAVQGEVFEGGKIFRLSLTRPPGAVGATRIHDATVILKGDATNTSFREFYDIGASGDFAMSSNPARFRLGHAYAASPVSGQTAGDDGKPEGQPASIEFEKAITDLENRDPFFNLLCLPDLVRPKISDPLAAHHSNAAKAYAEAARVCSEKFAFLIVDPPPNVTDVGQAEAWVSLGMGFSSSHAGGWFPRIKVDDPLHPGSIIEHPPSGAIAGIIARTDAKVGVWQPPAGTDAVVAGAYGPAIAVSDREHGVLNPLGLNAIRKFPIYQTVAFGSRTIEGSNALGSEWKYIPVRRTADYILRSLSEALRWAVHKPNGEDLWSQLRVSVTAFMHGLYRQGAFKGGSAREAYFVACDASTTTQADIDLGVVNVLVGFAPLKPAEFVVVTLRQIVQPAV